MRAPSQDVWWNLPMVLAYVARLETESRGAPYGRVVGGGGGKSGVYGCFGVLSRTALQPLGYGRGWSFLQWCRKRLLSRSPSKIFHASVAPARPSPPLPPRRSCNLVQRLPQAIKPGAKYNNDHLLTFCLSPYKWKRHSPVWSAWDVRAMLGDLGRVG